jgi:tetratricopeptide (TPR) repeat protein
MDRLKQGRHRFSEGLIDRETADHLEAAIHSREVHGDDLGFAFWMAAVCARVLDEPNKQGSALIAALELLPAEDEAAIHARSELAGLYCSLGRYPEAEPHLRTLLDMRRDHAYASDWLILLALCITDRPGDLSQAQVEEATAYADEGYALLTTDGPIEVITEFPYDRALLQAMTARALCWSMSNDTETRHRAVDAFRAADEFGRERIGPEISPLDLLPVYEGWVGVLKDLGLLDDAIRVADHASRVTGREVKGRNLRRQ